jgi:hypothetical protein
MNTSMWWEGWLSPQQHGTGSAAAATTAGGSKTVQGNWTSSCEIYTFPSHIKGEASVTGDLGPWANLGDRSRIFPTTDRAT